MTATTETGRTLSRPASGSTWWRAIHAEHPATGTASR